MYASMYGHLDVVRTLIEAEADIKAQSNVRNQMMMVMVMMMMMIILLTIMMMMIVIDVFMLIIDNYDDSN